MRLVGLFVLVLGCGGGDDPGMDAGICVGAADCDDGTFCNGAETCAAGECVPASTPCMPTQTCDEEADTCESVCAVDGDADDDGRDAVACGGDDCDDADRNAFPGNAEVCDPAAHDEDCDPATYGFRDGDGDTYPDVRCCNGTTCGTDCDDAQPAVHPSEAESCDGLDNDCDMMTDEMVQQPFYPDADDDTFGERDTAPVFACSAPPDHVANDDDCDDTMRTSSPASSERCADLLDNDCDDLIDEMGDVTYWRDSDDDGFGDPGTLMLSTSCTPPPDYVTDGTDCDDSDADIHPGVVELCDRIDGDCSLPGGAARGPEITEDMDQDAHAPTTATCAGGYPIDDCNDAIASVHLGAAEGCDAIDNDCDTNTDEMLATWCGVGATCDGACTATARVASGNQSSCAIASDGRLFCWGENVFGQLGAGTGPARGSPAPATGLASVAEVAVSFAHVCARNAAGAVYCWGRNANGQVGDGTTTSRSVPTLVPAIADSVELAMGGAHSCARLRSGQVRCWGANNDGQLGDGTAVQRTTPVSVVGLANAVRITAGGSHTCARRFDGTVVCWGANRDGQLGDASTSGSLVPVGVIGLAASSISAGIFHTCAINAAGELQCWGDNTYGQLTFDPTIVTFLPRPTRARGVTGIVEVDASSENTCGRDASGAVFCWGGLNSLGELGDGSLTEGADIPRYEPVRVAGVSDAQALATGAVHACASRSTGGIACWGMNSAGELGDGTITSPRSMVTMDVVTDSLHVDAGRTVTCGVRSSGRVACTGANDLGQLGDGTNRSRISPIEIPSISANEVSVGIEHACARTGTTAVCWGSNFLGQLGDGTTTDRRSPVLVSGLTDAAGISAANSAFSCALRTAGTVTCWGANGFGQLGDGTTTNRRTPGLPVLAGASALSGVAQVGAGGLFACARTATEVWCWGSNTSGQLGVTGGPFTSAQIVPGLSNPVEIAVGDSHACARVASGEVYCWGENDHGQIGNGSTGTSIAPFELTGLSGATSIAAGFFHTCAVDSAELYCWGSSGEGQVGDGTVGDDVLDPTLVPITGVVAPALGDRHSCARMAGGGVVCWGSFYQGELGQGALRQVIGVP